LHETMDGYAPAYVANNIPLLIVSGLDSSSQDDNISQKTGVRITSSLPTVESADAQSLLAYFKASDARGLAWSSRGHSGNSKFRVKIVGRVDSILN
jgi:hypothetical protein